MINYYKIKYSLEEFFKIVLIILIISSLAIFGFYKYHQSEIQEKAYIKKLSDILDKENSELEKDVIKKMAELK